MLPTLSEGFTNLLDDIYGSHFKDFLTRHSSTTDWIISADFCFHKGFENRVIAITIIPIATSIEQVMGAIKQAMPKDIKHIRSVSEDAIRFINDDRHFHFAFVINDPVKIVTSGADDPKAFIQTLINQLYDGVSEKPHSKEALRPFGLLRSASKAKAFDLIDCSDLMIFSSLLSGIITYASKYVPFRLVGLFPDRDTLTNLYDSIYMDLTTISVTGHYFLNGRGRVPFEITVGKPNLVGKIMWYDELIRIPDYIANLVSKWDLKNLPSLDDKASPIFYDAYVDSKNLAVINIHQTDNLHLHSIKANGIAD